MTTEDLLRALCPKCDVRIWAVALSPAMAEREITTPLRVAAFLAQLAHESVGLTRFEENLNYSAEGLLKTFRKYFTPEGAVGYARQPQKIANRVYANRMENGDEASGDGWLYRGRGPIQLTGRRNYRAAGTALGLKLEVFPDQVKSDPAVGARVACWFWYTRMLNTMADEGPEAFEAITRAINGGLNGLDDRRAYYAKALVLLGKADLAA